MKKTFLIALLLVTAISFSQEEKKTIVKKHELKVDAFNLIIFKAAGVSYEYLIDSESSFGVSLLFNLHEDDSDAYIEGPYYYEKFAFTPFYRRYFSSKHAWGFFIETFGMYNVQKDYDRDNYDSNTGNWFNKNSNEKASNVAFGVAVGAKFVSKNGFAFEFFGGAGRNVYSSNNDFATEIVPRAGVSFGYRF